MKNNMTFNPPEIGEGNAAALFPEATAMLYQEIFSRTGKAMEELKAAFNAEVRAAEKQREANLDHIRWLGFLEFLHDAELDLGLGDNQFLMCFEVIDFIDDSKTIEITVPLNERLKDVADGWISTAKSPRPEDAWVRPAIAAAIDSLIKTATELKVRLEN